MTKKHEERRREPRVKLSQMIRVRIPRSSAPIETYDTTNVSRKGVYFITNARHYSVGIEVRIIRNYHPMEQINSEETGHVVRIDKLKDGRAGVALSIDPLDGDG